MTIIVSSKLELYYYIPRAPPPYSYDVRTFRVIREDFLECDVQNGDHDFTKWCEKSAMCVWSIEMMISYFMKRKDHISLNKIDCLWCTPSALGHLTYYILDTVHVYYGCLKSEICHNHIIYCNITHHIRLWIKFRHIAVRDRQYPFSNLLLCLFAVYIFPCSSFCPILYCPITCRLCTLKRHLVGAIIMPSEKVVVSWMNKICYFRGCLA